MIKHNGEAQMGLTWGEYWTYILFTNNKPVGRFLKLEFYIDIQQKIFEIIEEFYRMNKMM